MGNIKEMVLSEYKKGNIVICKDGGALSTMPLSEFLKQPIEGVLYDLNRSEEVILQFIEDPKWINDFAACQVIRALSERIAKLESELPFVAY